MLKIFPLNKLYGFNSVRLERIARNRERGKQMRPQRFYPHFPWRAKLLRPIQSGFKIKKARLPPPGFFKRRRRECQLFIDE
jgi:hypothetical protein